MRVLYICSVSRSVWILPLVHLSCTHSTVHFTITDSVYSLWWYGSMQIDTAQLILDFSVESVINDHCHYLSCFLSPDSHLVPVHPHLFVHQRARGRNLLHTILHHSSLSKVFYSFMFIMFVFHESALRLH